jgi:hypothetical protein
MTEQEWLECGDPTPMLASLRGKASKRKVRLFGLACCRPLWGLLPTDSWRWAVEVAEAYADGAVSRFHHEYACKAAAFSGELTRHAAAVYHAYVSDGSPARTRYVCSAAESADPGSEPRMVALLRDIIGNPFRPVTLDPSWLSWNGGLVPRLAQVAYDERTMPTGTLDLDRLAVLADALEDAGCGDAAILGHLRGPGVHVRGCWVVDLVLEKE